jgi:beta-lactamase class D
MSNTCEQMADDARLEFLTSCMIVDEKNDRVWSDYDSYLREKNQALALKSRFEVMLYLQGLDADFLEKTPEAVAMKDIEADVLQKATLAAEALEAVQKEVEETEKIEKETPKKTRKKRTTKKKED